MLDKFNLKQWLPVICLSFSAFVFNTTEFVPIALLTDIARDLHITEAQTGTLITGYAWYVAIFSLPLMLFCAKFERRKLLFVLFVLFTVSHLLSAVADSFALLLASRLGIATAHSVFWSITVPLSVRLAPVGESAKALGFIATGSSLAMVLGLPIGRTVGLLFGWRVTFLVIAAAALLCLFFLLKNLPVLPSKDSGSLKSLPIIFKRKALVNLYFLTATLVTAHFIAYTYIEPFLLQISGFSEGFATLALLVYGLAGIGGSILYAKSNEAGFCRNIFAPVLGIIISLFLMRNSPFYLYPLFLVAFWGACIMLFSLNGHERVIRFASDATDVAMSLYSGIFNIGIGAGALVGGLFVTQMGLSVIGFYGALLAVPTLIFCYFIQKNA